MYLPAITAAYWRTIKRGGKLFKDVPDELKAGVVELAMQELSSGIITAEQYAQWIGIPKEI